MVLRKVYSFTSSKMPTVVCQKKVKNFSFALLFSVKEIHLYIYTREDILIIISILTFEKDVTQAVFCLCSVKVPSPFATADTEDTEASKGTQKQIHEYNKRLQSLLKMSDRELSKK